LKTHILLLSDKDGDSILQGVWEGDKIEEMEAQADSIMEGMLDTFIEAEVDKILIERREVKEAGVLKADVKAAAEAEAEEKRRTMVDEGAKRSTPARASRCLPSSANGSGLTNAREMHSPLPSP
jgi:hypothetical protein